MRPGILKGHTKKKVLELVPATGETFLLRNFYRFERWETKFGMVVLQGYFEVPGTSQKNQHWSSFFVLPSVFFVFRPSVMVPLSDSFFFLAFIWPPKAKGCATAVSAYDQKNMVFKKLHVSFSFIVPGIRHTYKLYVSFSYMVPAGHILS